MKAHAPQTRHLQNLEKNDLSEIVEREILSLPIKEKLNSKKILVIKLKLVISFEIYVLKQRLTDFVKEKI